MALITVHLYNSNDKQDELIVNTEHIITIEAANDHSANIQMTSGPTIRTAESVAELAALIGGDVAYVPPALETKEAAAGEAESQPEVTETAAERKARLKAEAEAAKNAQQ